MPFSILSWNIEHFRGGAARLTKAVAHIKAQKPDVFGLLEIEGADVKSLIEGNFPGYAVFSQKREFKAFNPSLRPGALLTVRHGVRLFDLLFLHTDSGRTAKDERVTEPSELSGLAELAARVGMRILAKSHGETWSNSSGSMTSNLDHVRGWVDLSGAARRKFIAELSDHSSLYAEVK